jgi:hypothetical protein
MARLRAICGLLLTLFLTSSTACALLPWKKSHSSYTKEELARLSDKDIYVIDGEKYVKVPSGEDDEGKVRFTYVKVDRYLAGEVEPLSLEAERVKREARKGVERETVQEKKEVTVTQAAEAKETPSVATRLLKHPYLKRKIAVLPFEDRTKFTFEKFGEILADRLAQKIDSQVYTSLVMDREMVRLALGKLGLTLADLKDPAKTKLLNKALGVQGIIVGAVYGPFVTSANEAADEKVSMAIVRIEAKFIDATRGLIAQAFVATNPLADSAEFGVLSEEKAKYRAVDLAIDHIIAQVTDEINGMDWLTRIALVEGNTVYLNAGYQTGLKTGDLLEVYPAGDLKGANPIGRIQVSKLFGVDAAVAQVIRGKVQIDAVVKPLPQS